MKTLILGLWAFGFAVAKHLGENHPHLTFLASEKNEEIYSHVNEHRSHPYFFDGTKLPNNVELVDNVTEVLPDIDIVISVIPCQFIAPAFFDIKTYLKPGVTIVNLAKWINNTTLKVASETLSEVLAGEDYIYAYLAGWMIANELVEWKKLWADIATSNPSAGDTLLTLFESDALDINIIIGKTKNTELYAALKNVIALILGYYEGQGYGASSLWYYLTELLKEVSALIELLGWEEHIQFTDYALWGDIIATCFGWSRNRLLGNMLWKWQDIISALKELKDQKKIAEWYETLKGVYTLTEWKHWFEEINNFAQKYL